MRIWEVKYTFKNESLSIDKNDPDDDIEYSDGEDMHIEEFISSKFYLGSEDIADAMMLAIEICEERLGNDEVEYEINGVHEIEGLEVINWPGEGQPCQCPFCRAERLTDQATMKFDCYECGEHLSVAVTGWESVLCPKCNAEIFRDGLIDVGDGNYKIIKVSGRQVD